MVKRNELLTLIKFDERVKVQSELTVEDMDILLSTDEELCFSINRSEEQLRELAVTLIQEKEDSISRWLNDTTESGLMLTLQNVKDAGFAWIKDMETGKIAEYSTDTLALIIVHDADSELGFKVDRFIPVF